MKTCHIVVNWRRLWFTAAASTIDFDNLSQTQENSKSSQQHTNSTKIENGQGQCYQIVKTFDTLKESKSVKTRSDSSGQDSGSMSASGIDFDENRAGWASGNAVNIVDNKYKHLMLPYAAEDMEDLQQYR